MSEVKNLVCGYCSTGCSLQVSLNAKGALSLRPNREYSVNRGVACPKGWEALTPLRAPNRATTPLLRDRRGKQAKASWETALQSMVDGFAKAQDEHGPESVAFLSTGQIPTEEMALLGALAKFGMGMVHGDGNTRQCMATAAVAYKESFGFDAPPYSYADFEESDAIVLWGANVAIAHPIMWEKALRSRRAPEIIVVDPRRTETAAAASQHLALRPKSDMALAYGVAHILIQRGWIDEDFIREHTAGFEEMARHVNPYTLSRCADMTQLSAGSIEKFAETIHTRARTSFWWTMGVNQSHQGVRSAQSIINLALMTGNIGKPGTGANSITGQCNAMGSRLFSNTSCLFGGRSFASDTDRKQVANLLEIPEARIPSKPSLAYDQILESIIAGKTKALWVVGTNPAHSWINQRDIADILSRLDLLVVQDMYSDTETAQLADIVLPAAGWGEKEGTFINSERRIARIRAVSRPPGEALTDFEIFQRVAKAWGCGDQFRDWDSPEAVFSILKKLSIDTPCDFSGIADYQSLDSAGGIQWPFPAKQTPSVDARRRLFADGQFFTKDARARFIVDVPTPAAEAASTRYPFLLLTGRGDASSWHTRTRTNTSAVLRSMAPENLYVEINTSDARRLSITSDEKVRVESRRSSVVARAFVTPTIGPGQVFAPMHYPEVNQLTYPEFDPHSRQPSYKNCAVALRKLERWER